jgi:hypothetical protein
MYPVVPFVLVLLIVGLQLIPAGIGGWIYSSVILGGLAVSAIEKVLWLSLVLLLIVLSLYMITSSIFALCIVTLPEMTPIRALRSARGLVLHRRWVVARKCVAMLVVLLLLGAVIMTPFLLWWTTVAEAVFVIITSLGVIIPVVYLHSLYIELLNE